MLLLAGAFLALLARAIDQMPDDAIGLENAPAVPGWTPCFGVRNLKESGHAYPMFRKQDLINCPYNFNGRWAFYKVAEGGTEAVNCGETDKDKVGWEFWGEGAEETLGYYMTSHKQDGRIFPSTDTRGSSSSCLIICSKHWSGGGFRDALTFMVFADKYPFFGDIYLYWESDPSEEVKAIRAGKALCGGLSEKRCGKTDGCEYRQYGDTYIDYRGNVKTKYKCQWTPPPTMPPVEMPTPECSGEMVYRECGTACPLKCGEKKPEACTKNCVAECQCPADTWELLEGEGDVRCVKEEECPLPTTLPPTVEPLCKGDQVFKECGTACPPTCGEPKPEVCTKNCVAECQCPEGMWLLKGRMPGMDTCVKEEQCPAPCPGDTKFDQCGTACEKTCGEPAPEMCTKNCVAECQCARGEWRTADDKCVASEDMCPKTECPGETEFDDCGTACPKVCGEEEPEFCTEQCVAECQCPDDKWRTADDLCVEKMACPVTPNCPGELEFNSCGTACPKVCGEPEPEFCTKNCVAECQCPSDKWRTEDNMCVDKMECPKMEDPCEGLNKKDCNKNMLCVGQGKKKAYKCALKDELDCKKIKSGKFSKEECENYKGYTGCTVKANKKKPMKWKCKGKIDLKK